MQILFEFFVKVELYLKIIHSDSLSLNIDLKRDFSGFFCWIISSASKVIYFCSTTSTGLFYKYNGIISVSNLSGLHKLFMNWNINLLK